MTQSELLKRVEALEREVREIRAILADRGVQRRSSYRDFVGMFDNDQDFKRAMELGVAYRRSLWPKVRRRRASKT